MNARFFLKNFFAFIAVNSLKMGNTGELRFPTESGDRTQVRTQRRNLICPCVYVLQTMARKEFLSRVRTGCKENCAGRAKFVVFHLLIGLIAVAVTIAFVVAPRIYRCA